MMCPSLFYFQHFPPTGFIYWQHLTILSFLFRINMKNTPNTASFNTVHAEEGYTL